MFIYMFENKLKTYKLRKKRVGFLFQSISYSYMYMKYLYIHFKKHNVLYAFSKNYVNEQ